MTEATGAAAPRTTAGAEQWNRRYADSAFVWTMHANRFVEEMIAGLKPGRALDLAAGEGRNAVWLAERGWDVLAVDFSDVGLEKARKFAGSRNVGERLSVEVADLNDYEPEAGGFDLVLIAYLQLPQAELAPILARAAKAVAPGGTFLLVAHDSENLAHGYGGPKSPHVLYTAADVVAALGEGLTIEVAERVERPVETDDGAKVALDCLVRARRA